MTIAGEYGIRASQLKVRRGSSCRARKLKKHVALIRYKERALKYVKLLEEHIATDVAARQPTGVKTLFSWFGFAVMGDFAFGNSFSVLHNNEWDNTILRVQEGLELLGPLSPVPWLMQLGFNVAGFLPMNRNWFAMLGWCRRQMEIRAKVRLCGSSFVE